LKVIIIEDSAIATILIQKVLEKIPIISDIYKFDNGHKFVVWTKENPEKNRPDVIITDINMPKLDGIGVLKHVNQSPFLEQTKVIVISANQSKNMIIDCLRLGADNYITKPFNPEKLRKKLEQYLLETKTEEEELKGLINSIVKDVFEVKYNNLKFADDYYQYKKLEKEILLRLGQSYELDKAIHKLTKQNGKGIND